MAKEKVFEVEFTLEELEVLKLALCPNNDFSRTLALDSRLKGLNVMKRLKVADDLRKRITDIIQHNNTQ